MLQRYLKPSFHVLNILLWHSGWTATAEKSYFCWIEQLLGFQVILKIFSLATSLVNQTMTNWFDILNLYSWYRKLLLGKLQGRELKQETWKGMYVVNVISKHCMMTLSLQPSLNCFKEVRNDSKCQVICVNIICQHSYYTNKKTKHRTSLINMRIHLLGTMGICT